MPKAYSKRRADGKPLKPAARRPTPDAKPPTPDSRRLKPDAILAARRRCFFASVNAQGLDEDTQLLIADRFIPDKHPDKFDRSTGALSRKAIFSDAKVFAEVMQHLSGKNSRARKDLKSPIDLASRAMYGQAFKLARKLGWDANGEDDLRFRLQQFASRQLSSSSGIVYLFEALTSAQLMRVIEGLKAMAARLDKKC